jgi:TolB protein
LTHARPIAAGIIGLALALAGLGVRAQEPVAGAGAFPAVPTLVFPPFPLTGTEARSDDAKEFRTTALRDLKNSGAFRLLTGPGGAPAPKPGHVAAPDLMLRFVSHSVARGKLLVEGECINLATGAVVLKKSFLGQTAVVDRMAHRLVDFLVGRVTGTPGVADSTIVFTRATAPGIQEIFGADRDGRNQRQLTSFGSLTTHPAISGDGRLAFVTYKGGPPQIWGQLKPKGPFQLIYPKGSPAGLELSDLAWSPDGQRLAFVQATRKGLADIQVLDLASGQVARLTEGHTSRGPSWSPDGSSLAFLSDRDGTSQVFIMAGDGSHARLLTSDPSPKACAAWNAKGDRIAYSARADGATGLYILGPDGKDRQRAASVPEAVASLCWAPDGRSLLLGLGAGADARLRIADLDGKIQDFAWGLDGSQFPQWVQNPAPVAELGAADHALPYPVPALLGAAPLP